MTADNFTIFYAWPYLITCNPVLLIRRILILPDNYLSSMTGELV